MNNLNIYNMINSFSPFELQEKWDNSGLLVGSKDKEVSKIYISLDLDLNMIDSVDEGSLVITHHPLIFSPLKQINFDSYSTMLLQKLIQKDISLISVHTNFDKTHLNDYFTEKILDFKTSAKDGFMNYVELDIKFDDLYNHINNTLGIKDTAKVKCHDTIRKIGICTGSGSSLVSNFDGDCILTGDITYHNAMEAKARGISLIDIKHYESEKCFSDIMNILLDAELIDNDVNHNIELIKIDSMNPFD